MTTGLSALVRSLNAAAFSLGLISAQLSGATLIWDGEAGTPNWGDAANWTGDVLPAAGDILYLVTNAGQMPTNIDLSNAQVGTVMVSGPGALTVTGNPLTVDVIRTRLTRNVTYTSGSTTVTVVSAEGTTGIYPGMPISGTGIPAGTTVASVVDATTLTISAAATQNQTNQGRQFDSPSNVTWNSNLIANNPTGTWQVGSGRTLTINGDISGIGGVAEGNVDGVLALRGTNTYAGNTFANTGTVQFFSQAAISPNSLMGSSFGTLRFLSDSPNFAYQVGNTIETGQSSAGFAVDGGGVVTLTGILRGRGTAERGFNFTRGGGSGAGIIVLAGDITINHNIDVGPNLIVRLQSPFETPFNPVGSDNSSIQGTLDLMGNDFDRRIRFENQGGVNGSGNIVNSRLDTPSVVSGTFTNLGTNQGSQDFGGPGTVIVTGPITVNTTQATGTAYDKTGPGAVIIRSSSFTDTTPVNVNNNEISNGTFVLDHGPSNATKITNDRLSLGNARFVVLGNNSLATDVVVADLRIDLGNGSSVGFAEVEIRSGTGAGASFTFNALTGLADTEAVSFSAIDGGGGVPTINTSMADGPLTPNVTFNRNAWAQVSGGQVVALNPDLVAGDAATFQSSSGLTQNIDVVGSFALDTATQARTLRFAQAAPTTLTLDAGLALAANNGMGGILIPAGGGAVTIDGSSALDVSTNSSLVVHHYGSAPLQIDARITGGPGAEFVKVGPGEVILTHLTSNFGNSSPFLLYEGTVTTPEILNAGVSSPLGNSGTINIGAKNTIDYATGVATEAPATLRYIGEGSQTNRSIALYGVAEIKADGTGLLDFTNTGNVVTTQYGSWNNLYLSGSGDGRLQGAIALGHADLIKQGAGEWTLSNTSTVTTFGKVVVAEGRLQMDGSVNAQANAIVLDGGILGGNGTFRGNLQVDTGGVLAPGASAGTLVIGAADAPGFGNLQMMGTYQWELATLSDSVGGVAGTDWDLVRAFGDIWIEEGAIFEISVIGLANDPANPFWLQEHTWKAMESVAGTISDNGFGMGGQHSFAGGSFGYEVLGGSLYVTFVPIPEPATLAALFGLLALVAVGIHRRRRS